MKKLDWLNEIINEIVSEEWREDIMIDEISAEITIEVYDQSEEIITPEVVGQHGYEIDEEFYQNWLSKEEIEKIKKVAKKEFPKVKKEGYIGSEKDYIIEMLDEYATKIWEKEIEKEIEEWERKESKTINYKGYPINIYTQIIEKECYVNIPHIHMFKGFIILVPIITLEENPSKKEIELQKELLEYALELNPYELY